MSFSKVPAVYSHPSNLCYTHFSLCFLFFLVSCLLTIFLRSLILTKLAIMRDCQLDISYSFLEMSGRNTHRSRFWFYFLLGSLSLYQIYICVYVCVTMQSMETAIIKDSPLSCHYSCISYSHMEKYLKQIPITPFSIFVNCMAVLDLVLKASITVSTWYGF